MAASPSGSGRHDQSSAVSWRPGDEEPRHADEAAMRLLLSESHPVRFQNVELLVLAP